MPDNAPRLHTKPPQTTPAHRKQLRTLVRASVENRPGVYRMLGPTGTVIYVGQSRVLRTRLLSYFRATGRRNKAARILRHAFQIEWEYTNTEFGALLRELRLIKQYRPHFNTMMVMDEWPRAYVALTGGTVPGLRVVARSDEPSAIALFGPFRRVAQLRDAVRALAEATGLRDCTLEDTVRGTGSARGSALWFNTDPATRPRGSRTPRTRAPGCLRHDLGTCAGPCIGAGEPVPYRDAATTVRAFLEGQSSTPVQLLEQAMHNAANDLAFERAGVLRDRLALVQWLHERVQHFHANVDRLTFRYHAVGHGDAEWVYLVRRGTVRAEVRAPQSEQEQAAFKALVARIYEGPDLSGADIPTHDLDEFYLVASWFRRRAEEKQRTRAPRS
ncbi:GIY-YIG nuclease family protein [Gemmatimonas sp.]|jgi:excinuclease UvrABC nuclease subunit|uniref:GIY-YIG nuclease family protein n=1 Tax=Gemmatimonas sp. TaxID=1962908 RepID=UPI0037C09B64